MFNKKKIEELEKELGSKECLLDKQKAVLENQQKQIEELRKALLQRPFPNIWDEKEEEKNEPLFKQSKKALLKECLGNCLTIFSFDEIELIPFHAWKNKLTREDFYNGIKYHRQDLVKVLDEMKLSEIKEYFNDDLIDLYENERERHTTFLNGLLKEAMEEKVLKKGKK